MAKKKNLPVFEHITISGVAAEGKALVRINDIVTFVPNCVPGDVVDLQITKKKHSFMEGKVLRLVQPSTTRCAARCKHFGVCGGCKWQALNYDSQLEAKQRQVRDNLERLGNIDCSGMRPICGSENIYYYRNKLEFTFSTKAWRTAEEMQQGTESHGALGFHIPQLFDKVLNIAAFLFSIV